MEEGKRTQKEIVISEDDLKAAESFPRLTRFRIRVNVSEPHCTMSQGVG